MIQITETIQYNKGILPLNSQSDEFKAWYYKNVGNKENDLSYVQSYDQYNRPYVRIVEIDEFEIGIFPQYLEETNASWAMSGINVTLKFK